VTQHPFPAGQSRARRASDDADVIVVGAGPGGSSAAYHLARAGLDVLVLEKSTFPREKVCGDGLTPRAVKQLVGMGIALEPADGWFPNKGIRIIGGGARIELDWPSCPATRASAWSAPGAASTRSWPGPPSGRVPGWPRASP
jgi:2-polyprenyl-6-methoxyphenol hydroxylase-like FAD-dependent oxidoreductase